MAVKLLCLAVAAACWLFTLVNARNIAEDCPPCNIDQCPPLQKSDCPAGITIDRCSCCEVCGLELGEKCNVDPLITKPDTYLGRCGENMECRVRTDVAETTEEESICYCMFEDEICGTDAVTYKNLCKLMEAAYTSGKQIKAVSKGMCPMAPMIISDPQSMKNVSGTNIAISCEAKGFPIPSIVWTYKRGAKAVKLPGDDMHISTNARGGPEKFQVTGWLQIMDLTESHEGDYTCIAENSEGVAKAVARVKVMPKESILHGDL